MLSLLINFAFVKAMEQSNEIRETETRTAFEHREYCSGIFLDVSQAFDRVWLDGLMHEIKKTFA